MAKLYIILHNQNINWVNLIKHNINMTYIYIHTFITPLLILSSSSLVANMVTDLDPSDNSKVWNISTSPSFVFLSISTSPLPLNKEKFVFKWKKKVTQAKIYSTVCHQPSFSTEPCCCHYKFSVCFRDSFPFINTFLLIMPCKCAARKFTQPCHNTEIVVPVQYIS